MHIEARLFEFIAAFFFATAVAVRGIDDDGTPPAAWSGRAPPRWC